MQAVLPVHRKTETGVADQGIEVTVAVHIPERDGLGFIVSRRQLGRSANEHSGAIVEIQLVLPCVADQGVEIPVAVQVPERHGVGVLAFLGQLCCGVDEHPLPLFRYSRF